MVNADASSTGIEDILAERSHMVTWVDDTQNSKDPTLLDTLAYVVGGGTGRTRSKQAGGAREIRNWCSLTLVSGEHPILQPGSHDGAMNRTLETTFEAFPDQAMPLWLHQQLNRHYGFTGPQFVQALLDRFILPGRLDQLEQLYGRFRDRLDEKTDGRPDPAAAHVALLATADMLARVHIMGETEESAEPAALVAGKSLVALAHKAGRGLQDKVAAAYDTIVAFVAGHPAHFGVRAEKEMSGANPPDRWGAYAHAEVRTKDKARLVQIVAILPARFTKLATEQKFNAQQVLHGLKKRGVLLTQEDDRLTRKTATLGPERPGAYWIRIDEEAETLAATDPKHEPSGTRDSEAGHESAK